MIRTRNVERAPENPTEISEALVRIISDDLRRHEGVVNAVYLDSEGLRTFGIGHLITPKDPEHFLEVGAHVSPKRVEEVFKQDLQIAIDSCEELCLMMTQQSLYSYPESVQRVLVNMTFNLGVPRFRLFKRMWAALKQRDYVEASKEMVDSKWYRQVKGRAKELTRMMEWSTDE